MTNKRLPPSPVRGMMFKRPREKLKKISVRLGKGLRLPPFKEAMSPGKEHVKIQEEDKKAHFQCLCW